MLLLVGSAVALEHLHVAGVGLRAVEALRRDRRAAHDLAERRVLEIGQPGATLALRQEEIPEGALARLRLELLHDRGHLPASRPRAELVVEDLLVRVDVLVHEIAELLRVHLGLLRELEFHVGPPVALVRPRLYLDSRADGAHSRSERRSSISTDLTRRAII